jgi:hypothetical protein
MHQLIQAQTAISIQSPLIVSTTIAAQTQDLPESAADIIHEDESVSQTVSNDLAVELGPTTAKIVGSSVNIALEAFISDTQGDQCPREMQLEHPGLMSYHQGPLDDQKLIRSDRMRVIHQTTQERIYNTWLAIITIRSTTTRLQEIAEGDGYRQQDHVESFQTVLKIDIRPYYFIRACFLAVISRQGLGAHPLNSDMRIRCYNIVDINAPIVMACRRGDIATVRRLFASRQASPFDVVPHPYLEASNSLLAEAVSVCMTIPIPFDQFPEPHDMNTNQMINLLKLLEYLIDQGLDPGESIEPPLLWQLFGLLSDCDMVLVPIVQRVIRLVVERSVQNPFHCPQSQLLRKMAVLSYVTTSLSKDCIQTQEIWPITDLENAVKDLQSSPKTCGVTLFERAPALLKDPNGLRLRHYLQSFTYTSQQFVQYCAGILIESQRYPMETVCFAIEQRLIQCLQAGMNPQEPVVMKTWLGGHTLYSLASEFGALDILASALESTGRSTSEIDIIFEDLKYINLERELSSLRPTSLYRSLHSATPSSVLRSIATVFDESYQRLFPGEEIDCPSLFDIFGRSGFPKTSGRTPSNEELFNECVITDRIEDDYVFIMLASTAVQAKILEELKPFELIRTGRRHELLQKVWELK